MCSHKLLPFCLIYSAIVVVRLCLLPSHTPNHKKKLYKTHRTISTWLLPSVDILFSRLYQCHILTFNELKKKTNIKINQKYIHQKEKKLTNINIASSICARRRLINKGTTWQYNIHTHPYILKTHTHTLAPRTRHTHTHTLKMLPHHSLEPHKNYTKIALSSSIYKN